MRAPEDRQTRVDRKDARPGPRRRKRDESVTGLRIGAYVVERRIEKGGMGEILLARDERLDRPVAIKRIRRDAVSNEQHRERLWREARAIARLNHPAVAQIYDIVFDRHGDSIVMEYVEGRTLGELMAAGLVDGALGVDVAIQIAQGLAAAHNLGLVHRDLKSENVMVTPQAAVKILDFGLVKEVSEDTSLEALTQQGIVLGTVGSMSPEQASGEAVDHRSDLFSFGILLYEMFTGYSPFRGESWMETLDKVKQARPRAVAALRPELPESLVNLIHALLAREKTHRPGDGLEVVDALAAIAAESDLRRLPPPPVVQARLLEQAESSAATGPLVRETGSWPDLRPPAPGGPVGAPLPDILPPRQRLTLAVVLVLALTTALSLWLARRGAEGQPSWQELWEEANAALASADPATARRHLDVLLERSPDDVDALGLRAEIELLCGDPVAAEEHYTRLVAIAERPAFYDRLGTAHYLARRYDAAAESFERALQLAPGDLRSRYRLAQAELARGRDAQGRQQIDLVCSMLGQGADRPVEEPRGTYTDPLLRLIHAGCLAQSGHDEAAVQVAASILRDQPGDPETLLGAAEIFVLTGHDDRALTAAEAALSRGLAADWLRTPAFDSLADDPAFASLVGPNALE